MISIIIPLYNQAKKLDKCLESVKKQVFVNYEIIVVNDRSTDKLSWAIDKYKRIFGYKIRFVHNYTNHGAPYARNKGFRLSKGEYIIFCDADVLMHKDMLEKMYRKLKEEERAGFVYSGFKYGHKLFPCGEFTLEKLRKKPFIHSTSLIKREAFPEKGWDTNLKKFQDWDIWLTMAENGYAGTFIEEVLFSVMPGGTMSSWLPSFAYKYFPFLGKVREYKRAMRIVKKKHNIS